MSNKVVVNSLLLILISTIIVADQTIHSVFYGLNDEITGLRVGNSIKIEITFIDSIEGGSTLEIKTEKWVHDCCILATTKPDLSISFTQNGYIFPAITAYFRLRKPLSYIELKGAAHLIMKNHMKANSFSVQLSGASSAQMKIQLTGDLDVSVSGASHLIMDGFVTGVTSIDASGAATFDCQSCNLNLRRIKTSRASFVHLKDEQNNRIIKAQGFSIDEWLRESFGFTNTATKISGRSMYYFLMLFYIIYFFLF